MTPLILASDTVAVVAVGMGCTIALMGIIMGGIHKIVVGKAQERSRQDVAAYVAEGSMTADEGERLLKATKDED